jgi:hypothetical protein
MTFNRQMVETVALDELEKATVLSALRYWKAALDADSHPGDFGPFVDETLGTLTSDEIAGLVEQLEDA